MANDFIVPGQVSPKVTLPATKSRVCDEVISDWTLPVTSALP
jgi:hypothetical protein